MTIERLIHYVRSLSHEEIDQDLDSAVIVASINRGIRTLDDLHDRTGTFTVRAYTVGADIEQPMHPGSLDLTVSGMNAIALIHDGAVLRFTWDKDGEEKSAEKQIHGNSFLISELLGETPQTLRIGLVRGVVWRIMALYSDAYTTAERIPTITHDRLTYDARAYADDFLAFANVPPMLSYGSNVDSYLLDDVYLRLPDTLNADVLVEYRKRPREVTIDDFEERADSVSVDVAEDVVMMLPYLVCHDLFLDDNTDVALRCYNLYETERARYLLERANRRTLFRRKTYKGW